MAPGSRKSRATPIGGRLWATLGLAAVIALHLAGALPFQQALRTLSFDLYQRTLPRERVSAPVVIVDIDEASLEKFGQWPWPRNLTARLLDRIWKMEPAAVGLDIIMPEADRSSACEVTQYVPGIDRALVERICALPGNDSLLAASLRAGKSVLGVAGVDGKPRGTPRAAPMRTIGPDPGERMRRFDAALTNLPELDEAASGHAVLSTDMDRGGVRRIPMVARVGGTVMPSLSLEMLRVASESPGFLVKATDRRIEGVGIPGLFIPTQADGSLWVHYGHHDESRFVSAARVLDGSVDTEAFRQKLVLVGLSGLGLVDLQGTALGERIPGVEIHAQVLESIFDGTTLLRPHWAGWLEAALMLAVGLAISWGFPRLRSRAMLPVMLSVAALLWGSGLAAFANGRLLLDVASPIAVLVAMFGFMLADSLVREEIRRRSLERDLQAQREQAARARGEMEAARRIQMGILPDVRANFAGDSRLDIAARMEPAREVGGDLYDCFMLDEHRAFFSIGDVCGKGPPASLFMVISKTLCKSLALRDEQTRLDPGELMRQANLEISRDNPEMLFVTAFTGVLDLRTGELGYCNAGHDRPLVFSPGSVPAELEGASGPPLCVVDEFPYRTHRRQLAAGEFLCLITDGVTEAFDPSRALFGEERLVAALSGIGPDAAAQDVLDEIFRRVRAFEAGSEPSDDLTVLVLRWTPS